MTDRQSIERRAADWLALRDGGAWTARDARELDDWLAESTAHRVAFLRLESVWRGLDVIDIAPARWRVQPLPRLPGRALHWAAAAAAICVFSLTALLLLQPAAPAPQVAYATAVGEIRSVHLADGSDVDLNTDSRLRVEFGRDSRAVWLDQGEAFFSIKRDPARPFRILAEGQEVRVLGTRFSVRREPGEIRVMVVEGRVELRAGGERDSSVVLRTGDTAIVTRDAKLIARRNAESLRDAMGWRRSMLLFRGTRLLDVAVEFNRYNERKLVIADPDLNDMRIGGQFRTGQVEEFARLLETGYALKAVYSDREIRVSR